MSKHITAANIIVTQVIDNLYPAGVTIEGFSEDSLQTLDSLVLAESHMGIDGKLSHGFVESPVIIRLSLMPDQTGYNVYETWSQTMKTLRTILKGSLTIVIPGTKRKYTLTNGILNEWMSIPNSGKVLQASEAVMTYERCVWEHYEE